MILSWRRKRQSTPVFFPGEFHGQRSLAGYSLWGCKESDMTERLTHTLVHFRGVSKSFTISSAPSFSRETTLNWVGPAPRPAEIHPGRDVRWGRVAPPAGPALSGGRCLPSASLPWFWAAALPRVWTQSSNPRVPLAQWRWAGFSKVGAKY